MGIKLFRSKYVNELSNAERANAILSFYLSVNH